MYLDFALEVHVIMDLDRYIMTGLDYLTSLLCR